MIFPHKSAAFALLISAVAGISTAAADVQLSKLFGDHMVLQQEKPIRIWGKADAGEEVTVEFGGQSASAKAGADGRWRVDLEPMKADGVAHTMTVKGKNTVSLSDILLGEVWICSGQSNMEWSVRASANPAEEIAAADHPRIRLFNVPGHVAKPEADDDPRGAWKVCSPQSVPDFSAVGYYFGREVHKNIGVPVGLVGTNWGGTRIEPWTPVVGFKQVPSLEDYVQSIDSMDPASEAGKALRSTYLDQVQGWLENSRAAVAEGKSFGKPPVLSTNPKGGAVQIYNGMVHGLVPLSVRGAIWYQGESNAGDGLRYEFLKEALVSGWRKVFENDELAFYWVQLANFQAQNENPAGGGWGPVREGQRRALRISNTGMAVTTDVGEAKDIHPRNKQDVGKRLARWALAKNYGKDIVYSGPLYKGMSKEGSKIRILFDHVGSGLMTGKKEGQTPTEEVSGAELNHFAIQDAAGQWHWAKAKIDGDAVLVWHEEIDEPKHVRFAYQSNPEGVNLYNKEGLPASPFTTD